VATTICEKVGSVNKKLRRHTDMCHFVRKKEADDPLKGMQQAKG